MARYTNIGAAGVEATAGSMRDINPDIISTEVTASAAQWEVWRPLCRQFDITGYAVFNMPTTPALSFSAHTEGVSSDANAFDTGTRSIEPVVYKEDVAYSLKVKTASQIDPNEIIIAELGIALADHRDTLGGGLYSEAPASTPTHDLGTDGVQLSFTNIRDMQKLLYIQKAPRPFNLVVHPTQLSELQKDEVFISSSFRGRAVMDLGVQDNGFYDKVSDTNVFVSPDLTEASGLHAVGFGRGAFGYAYEMIESPLSPGMKEVMIDLDWDSDARAWNVNATYFAAFGGLKGTSTTTNNWAVDIIS